MSNQDIRQKLAGCHTEDELLQATLAMLREMLVSLEKRTQKSEKLIRSFNGQK